MYLQNTYFKDKFLASETLYRHDTLKAVQEYQSFF